MSLSVVTTLQTEAMGTKSSISATPTLTLGTSPFSKFTPLSNSLSHINLVFQQP